MKGLILIAIGAAIGSSATAMVYCNHIVQTEHQWIVVPRAGVNVKDIYADVREWSLDDWRKHPELTRDMVKAGHAEIIQTGAVENTVEQVFDRITQRPEADKSSAPVWEEEVPGPQRDDIGGDDAFQNDSIPR